MKNKILKVVIAILFVLAGGVAGHYVPELFNTMIDESVKISDTLCITPETKITLKQGMSNIVNEAVKSSSVKVTLEEDIAGPALFTASLSEGEAKVLVIDLNGKTYTSVSATGSKSTETQGFHFEKGWTVIIRNGTLKAGSSDIHMLIQNYANLTLENVIVDFRDSGYNYALSNNFGNITIKGNTQILVDEGKVAFDLYFGLSSAYYEGVSVTFDETFTGKVAGIIEYGPASTASGMEWLTKTKLVIKNGDFSQAMFRLTGCDNTNANITLPDGKS